jgi:positive regulator of sigma E activity
MKKVKFAFVLLLSFILIAGTIFFASAASQTISVTPTAGEAGEYKIYNISVANLNDPVGANFTEVSLTIPAGFTVASSGTDTGVTPTNPSANVFVFTRSPDLIVNGTLGYFWFNATKNQTGESNITVGTLDTSSVANSTNVTITISDTIAPSLSFISPTPSDSSTIKTSYIQANTSADETGSGLKNITIYLYNSTSLIDSHTGTSSPFFYNFTSLNGGVYSLNATAYDNSNNLRSISARTITLNVTSCSPEWTCTWGECVNSTQSQVCTDPNNCGITAGKPTGTQACVSCVTSWACDEWTPAACSGGNQTRVCNDANECVSPEIETRDCVAGTATSTGTSEKSVFSSSFLFFVVLGVIILSVVGVIILLMRMKRKSASSDSNSNNGYMTYPPRGPFPPSSPPGYPNPPRVYPNQPQAYQNNPGTY